MHSFHTKSQIAYETIKNFIVSGFYQPRDKVNIQDIAKKLDMSEIPIREALKQLEAENYVISIPHVGFKVNEITAKEIKEIFIVRIELEKLAADLAFSKIKHPDLEKLKMIQLDIKNCFEGKGSDIYWPLNKQFHEVLYSPCDNEVLVNMISQLGARSDRTRAIFKINPERAIASYREHEYLLAMIEKNDKQSFINGIVNHLVNALEAILTSHLVR